MRIKHIPTLIWLCIGPLAALAGNQHPETNVNSRYDVESVEVSGVDTSKIEDALNSDLQKLVGEKYNPDAAGALARRLRKNLPNYSITVKLKRGDKPDHIKVVFEAEKHRSKWFEFPIPPIVYHSKEGLSGSVEIPIEYHNNVFTFGIVNNADELLERNAGYRLRYENRYLGTEKLQFRLDFDSYHEKWNPATEFAAAADSEVPGIYRERRNLAPSLSLTLFGDLRLSVGTSFQRLEMQYPQIHTESAYAGTTDVQFHRVVISQSGLRQGIRAGYSMRTASRSLNSDFVYTRHFFSADYTLSNGKNMLGIHFFGGLISGNAPLFERFTFGNSFALRGWDKFDVAPLGGSRAAHGSLEYRYRPLGFFYDVGTVWDLRQTPHVRHSLGLGLFFKCGAFASLAFPVRQDHVTPVIMLGFRY